MLKKIVVHTIVMAVLLYMFLEHAQYSYACSSDYLPLMKPLSLLESGLLKGPGLLQFALVAAFGRVSQLYAMHVCIPTCSC